MKLLIGGKLRNVYFRKNDTAYYKSNGNQYDINKMLFKKTIILGGNSTFDTFSEISIKTDINLENKWNFTKKIEVYKKLLQMFLLSKIHCDNNDGRLFKEGTPFHIKENFIKIIKLITGTLEKENLESLISIGPLVNKDDKTTIAYFKQITADDKKSIKTAFDTIPYNLIGIKQQLANEIVESNENKGILDNMKKLMIINGLFNSQMVDIKTDLNLVSDTPSINIVRTKKKSRFSKAQKLKALEDLKKI
jgi:hypothetical protein